MIELPCAVGSEIYEICSRFGWIRKHVVKSFTVTDKVEFINCETANFSMKHDFDKTVFLSRTEAEKVIKND